MQNGPAQLIMMAYSTKQKRIKKGNDVIRTITEYTEAGQAQEEPQFCLILFFVV